jgi:hypothetical protein
MKNIRNKKQYSYYKIENTSIFKDIYIEDLYIFITLAI